MTATVQIGGQNSGWFCCSETIPDSFRFSPGLGSTVYDSIHIPAGTATLNERRVLPEVGWEPNGSRGRYGITCTSLAAASL
jgi:hypothetical protein